MYAEVVVALQKYNPDFRTAEGRSIKESTFVYTHLFHRVGQLCKKVTLRKYGYGMRGIPLEEALAESFSEEM